MTCSCADSTSTSPSRSTPTGCCRRSGDVTPARSRHACTTETPFGPCRRDRIVHAFRPDVPGLDEDGGMSDVLDRFTPATQDWFRGAFPAPTPAQAGAWDAISAGKHALV